MTAEIDIRNVSKSFGALKVIDNLSLSIPAHEFVVFVGPSGCGKSTLLRMIAGLEEHQRRHDRHRRRARRSDCRRRKRGLAMVFQSYALYPHMTVRQNMAFGLENERMPRRTSTSRVPRRPRTCWKSSLLLDRRPGQLSGGQRQRVAIGRAIVREPQALPVRRAALQSRRRAARAHAGGDRAACISGLVATMIYVTHDQIEAMTLADTHRRDEQPAHRADRAADGALRPAGHALRRRLLGPRR